MRKKKIHVAITLLLCIAMMIACGNSTVSSSSANEDGAEIIDDDQTQDIAQNVEEDVTELEQGDEDSSEAEEEYPAVEEKTEIAESGDDSLVEPDKKTDESDIQISPVGTVEMTSLSSEESRAFEGKEMTADADYLEQAISSDVYYCAEPLNRIEVHPIKQWAKDYSSFTISEEVLGTVESTDAEEPFRIFDIYPEGIPINCIVFYLEDGTCGTFSLGYNGSGKEHTWNNVIYNNYTSMDKARAKDLEEGAANWILDLYRDLAQNHHEQDYLKNGLLDGSIPSFGVQSLDYSGEPMYYSSESHFAEVCNGASISGIGTARIDLDNDGTDELIIGDYDTDDQTSDSSTILYAAYSVKNGEIRTIFQGWTRSYYFLAEDGSIIHGGSGGAMRYGVEKYSLAEDGEGNLSLKKIEAVDVDGDTYPDEPYFYYPEGRDIVGYDDYGVPEYSFNNVMQMDEETGRQYYDRIFDERIHIDLDEFDLMGE